MSAWMLNGSSRICSAILVESIKDKMGLLWQPTLAPHKQQYMPPQYAAAEAEYRNKVLLAIWHAGSIHMSVQAYNPLVINQLCHESGWTCNIFLAIKYPCNLWAKTTHASSSLYSLKLRRQQYGYSYCTSLSVSPFPDPISFTQSLQCIKFFDMDFCLLFPPPFLP